MGNSTSSTRRSRGRPKGTGINDRDTLASIATLLAKDTELKPTTAIKLVGITDPSIVRRLRDKLKFQPISEPVALPPVARRSTRTKRQPTDARSAERKSAVVHKQIQPDPAMIRQKPPLPQDTSQPVSANTKATSEASNLTPDPIVQPPASAPTAQAPGATSQHSAPDPQLEAMRLASEAATAMSRLYLHCLNYVAQINPFGLALHSQNMMSQWMMGMINAHVSTMSGDSPEN